MSYKDALELSNMFTMAAQIAKSKNKYEVHLDMDEATLAELLKKAFPSLKNKKDVINIAREILEQ